jgi:hypothetical protein
MANYPTLIQQKLAELNIENTFLYDSDNRYLLRPIYYTIHESHPPENIQTFNVIDPSQWTADPIYGNPGTLNAAGGTIGIHVETAEGTTVHVIIYFQKTLAM